MTIKSKYKTSLLKRHDNMEKRNSLIESYAVTFENVAKPQILFLDGINNLKTKESKKSGNTKLGQKISTQ